MRKTALRNVSGASQTRQKSVELLLKYADHFSTGDRALVRGIYQNGLKPSAMAKALGHTPKTTQDRLRRLMRRLGSPMFRFIIQHRPDWPERRRVVADAVLLRGQSQRATAAVLGVSQYIVRQEIDRVRLLCEQYVRSDRSDDRDEISSITNTAGCSQRS
jgi:hypothetical protein